MAVLFFPSGIRPLDDMVLYSTVRDRKRSLMVLCLRFPIFNFFRVRLQRFMYSLGYRSKMA